MVSQCVEPLKFQVPQSCATRGGDRKNDSLNVVVDKIDQVDEETAASSGACRVDNFYLWGASRCRRMGVTLSEGG